MTAPLAHPRPSRPCAAGCGALVPANRGRSDTDLWYCPADACQRTGRYARRLRHLARTRAATAATTQPCGACGWPVYGWRGRRRGVIWWHRPGECQVGRGRLAPGAIPAAVATVRAWVDPADLSLMLAMLGLDQVGSVAA